MSEAIQRVVGAYVKLGNRKALEDMRGHRLRLATELTASHGTLDLTSSIKLLEEEIAVIEEGIVNLDAPPPTWAAALDLGFPSWVVSEGDKVSSGPSYE